MRSPAAPACIAPGCTDTALPGRDHCERHHDRRRETWRAARKDYRDRQKARARLVEGWARLLQDTLRPATAVAYRDSGRAIDALERLALLIDPRRVHEGEAAYAELADALTAIQHTAADANRHILDMERVHGPLPAVLDPPPRPRESRATRLRREDEPPG
jgi:hypothetical protein